MTAFHEAGHAIVAHFLVYTDPVHLSFDCIAGNVVGIYGNDAVIG